jgi:hypothetical protein
LFSLTNFLDCGQDANRPRDCSAGLLLSNAPHTQRKKPCRINNQFATIHTLRQLAWRQA